MSLIKLKAAGHSQWIVMYITQERTKFTMLNLTQMKIFCKSPWHPMGWILNEFFSCFRIFVAKGILQVRIERYLEKFLLLRNYGFSKISKQYIYDHREKFQKNALYVPQGYMREGTIKIWGRFEHNSSCRMSWTIEMYLPQFTPTLIINRSDNSSFTFI